MLSVKQIIEQLPDLDGRYVEVVAPVAFSYGERGAEWLYDEAEDYVAAAYRVRVRPGDERWQRYVFRELRTGPAWLPPVEKHAAIATVHGQLRRSDDPAFSAEMTDLQWATLSFPAGHDAAPWPHCWEQRYSLQVRHPRLDQGIGVHRLLRRPEEWYAKQVRIWGYLVTPGHNEEVLPTPGAMLVAHPEEFDDRSKRIRIDRSAISHERKCTVIGEDSLRLEGSRLARCIMSGVLYPDAGTDATLVLRQTNEVCLSSASPPERTPYYYDVFGADCLGPGAG